MPSKQGPQSTPNTRAGAGASSQRAPTPYAPTRRGTGRTQVSRAPGLETVEETPTPAPTAQNPQASTQNAGATQKYTPPQARGQWSNAGGSLASRIAGMNLTANPQPPRQQQQRQSQAAPQRSWRVVNPSTAAPPNPTPSNVTAHLPPTVQGGTRYTSNFAWADGRTEQSKWIANDVCFVSPHTRQTFNKGDVISVPYHKSATNPTTKAHDQHLSTSQYGPVYTKRRMMVVLWKYTYGMFCVPLYSNSFRGIEAKFGKQEHEWIPVKDILLEDTFVNYSNKHANPLEFIHADHPNDCLHETTTCHMSEGVWVDWKEPITYVGRLLQRSYRDLVKHHKKLNTDAENEPYQFPDDSNIKKDADGYETVRR